MPRVKPCARCHHPKSRHRTHECRQTWQTRGQTFMGVSVITKWCTCDGYTPTTDEVEHRYAYDELYSMDCEADHRAFRRWLAAHDAEVRAQALREAASAPIPRAALNTRSNGLRQWLRA